MNNKGFAITTILYGTLILFLMLLLSLLGILSSYKDRLSLLIEEDNAAREIINKARFERPEPFPPPEEEDNNSIKVCYTYSGTHVLAEIYDSDDVNGKLCGMDQSNCTRDDDYSCIVLSCTYKDYTDRMNISRYIVENIVCSKG